jgi:hypothetical protein
MRRYVVYRHGYNEDDQRADQGLPEKMAVLRLEADSPEDACQRAAPQVRVAANQYLSAEPPEEVDAREETLNRTARASGAGEG